MEKTIKNPINWKQTQPINRSEQFKQRQERFQKIEQAATVLAVSIVIVGGAIVLVKLGGVMVKDLKDIEL